MGWHPHRSVEKQTSTERLKDMSDVLLVVVVLPTGLPTVCVVYVQ